MLNQISAVLNKVESRRNWHDFLLSHFFALYPMFQVKSAQRSHSYSFISELPMKEDGSFMHGETGPPLKSNRREQEVDMLLIKLPHKLFIS